MKREIAMKWTKALRSKEYKQAHKAMLSADGLKHCCLGVLCAILGTDEELLNEFDSMPSSKTLDLCDLSRDVAVNLWCMNDGAKHPNGMKFKKHSFKEIAEYIDYNWRDM